jgi:hypothetical protein
LGDWLLFVGEHSSVSLPAADNGGCLRIPRTITLRHLTSRHRIRNISPNNIFEEDFYGGCIKNSVFFTDDNRVRNYDSDWHTILVFPSNAAVVRCQGTKMVLSNGIEASTL